MNSSYWELKIYLLFQNNNTCNPAFNERDYGAFLDFPIFPPFPPFPFPAGI